MKTVEEVLEAIEAAVDRSTLEAYVARAWVRPVSAPEGWYFEEIDIARLQLVWHLAETMQVNDAGIDIVLSLLDQLYGLRAQLQQVVGAGEPAGIDLDI